MKKEKYHHGDLYGALVGAGIQILSEKGIEALTLREAARRAGVSHSAPYRHFKNKEELLGAVAAEGFRLLTGVLEKAVQKGAGNFREELRLSGRAYINFALSHPEHLKVMFSARRFDYTINSVHGLEDLDAFSKINGVFQRAMDNGVIKTTQSPPELALMVWAQVHGLSHIMIEEQIPPGTIPVEAVLSLVDTQVEFLWQGLRFLEETPETGQG